MTTEAWLGRGSGADGGMVLQTPMLAARGFGLDTCPRAARIPYQALVVKHLGIPADRALVCGRALGHADPTKIENTLVSEREALSQAATFHGFG